MTVASTRRSFLQTVAVSGAAMVGAMPVVSQAQVAVRLGSAELGLDFDYEVTRTEAEWRALLSDNEYYILRELGTEPPKSSPLWNEQRAGAYHCKGCDLHAYTSEWKVELDKGWVFFNHALPNSVLTDIDLGSPYAGMEDMDVPADEPLIELHCRRCGSHLGHLVNIGGPLHCINGTALEFKSAEA